MKSVSTHINRLKVRLSKRSRSDKGYLQSGFTLIEVMFALFIVATSLTMLLELSSTIASSSIIARDKVVGLNILQNYLTEQRIKKQSATILPGTTTTSYQINDMQYRIIESRSATDNDFILKVDLSVNNSNEDELARLFTYYVANPRGQ